MQRAVGGSHESGAPDIDRAVLVVTRRAKRRDPQAAVAGNGEIELTARRMQREVTGCDTLAQTARAGRGKEVMVKAVGLGVGKVIGRDFKPALRDLHSGRTRLYSVHATILRADCAPVMRRVCAQCVGIGP